MRKLMPPYAFTGLPCLACPDLHLDPERRLAHTHLRLVTHTQVRPERLAEVERPKRIGQHEQAANGEAFGWVR